MVTLAQPATSAELPGASSEVDVELLTFVERYATNPIRWELLVYFGRHPEAVGPVEIARRLRRSVKATIKELDDLTYLHVLARRYSREKVTYQLSATSLVRRAVRRLAEYADGDKPPPGA